jgi:hypothetical protein
MERSSEKTCGNDLTEEIEHVVEKRGGGIAGSEDHIKLVG